MITFKKWKNDVTSFDAGLTAIPPLKSAMFPLLKEARLTEASPPEAGYSPRTPAEAVKQCRRDGLCRVLWSWWPLTQEYSPEARNIIWLPAFKLELQSSKAQFRSKWAIFVLCDLEIWQMTMNKANLRDLIAATGLVISYSNWIRNIDFSPHVTSKLNVWPRKIIGHLFYTSSSFVHHFKSISEFKLELQPGNDNFFELCDLAIWRVTLKNNRAPLLCYFKLCAPNCSHWWIQTGVTVRSNSTIFKSRVTLKFDGWPWKTIRHLF